MRRHLFALSAVFATAIAGCTATVSVDEPKPEPTTLKFPDGFLLGTATAAHQVEGNLLNDMQQWEDVVVDGQCKIRNCDKTRTPTPTADWGSGRYEEDFARAKALGHNTIRVGFEWSRIEPYPGQISAAGVKYYHEMLAAMKKNGLKPMVTVNHFTLPSWIQSLDNRGFAVGATAGWLNPDIAAKMGGYAEFLAKEYGAEVDYWCTINEPWSVLLGGYLAGVIPPGKTIDFDGVLVAMENMLRAHAAIYNAIKQNDTSDVDGDGEASIIGIVRHDRKPLPVDPNNPKDVESAKKTDYVFTDIFNDAIMTGVADLDADGERETEIPGLKGTTDYWGVNYYGVIHMDSGLPLPYVGGMPELEGGKAGFPENDLGWGIWPEGMRERLNYYWDKWGKGEDGKVRYLIVTENGVADSQDKLRAKFLVDHIDQLLRAVVVDGVDVRGYYHWTLVDNFEWAEGYAAMFGLYQLDFATQERKETEGARAYKAIAEAGGITPEIRAKWATGDYAKPARLEQRYFAPVE